MKARTQNCSKHGHPEFSLVCDDASVFERQVKWLLDWLEEEVSRGKQFLPDQTVQVGWSVLKVGRRADESLALFEPDFKSVPMVFVDNVSKTLVHLLIQKSVTESLGLENEISLPSLRESAIICTDFGTGKGVFLDRAKPSGHASGWFFGCSNAQHNHQAAQNLRLVSLYEACVLLDETVIPYLGLPAGIKISFSGAIPRFFLNERELLIKHGSYLDKKFLAQKNP